MGRILPKYREDLGFVEHFTSSISAPKPRDLIPVLWTKTGGRRSQPDKLIPFQNELVRREIDILFHLLEIHRSERFTPIVD